METKDNKPEVRHTIHCRYSGMPLPTYADFPSLPIKLDAHILMRVPFEMLIDEINHRKVLSDRQRRLCFIAMLKNTDLVIFEHPAIPTDRTINIEFSRLIHIAHYILGHRSFYHSFPKYKVTKQDAEISNISHVIDAWYEIKEKHVLKKEERDALFEIHAQEELERKVTHAIVMHKPLTPTFNKHLIKWALTESNADLKNHIKWAKIFLTKDNKMCKMCNGKKLVLNALNREMEKCPNCEGKGIVSDISKLSFRSVQELRNYMVDNLPDNTSYETHRKYVVLKHLGNKLQVIKKLHAAFGLTMLDDVPPTAEQLAEGRSSIQVEPKKEQFKTVLEYVRALAKFRAAQDVVETEPELPKNMKELPDDPDLDLEKLEPDELLSTDSAADDTLSEEDF